ncbi:TerC family protein [Paenibacillus thiaminolyticus]|nr:TerC family protein [Paenibacillus thiaminolyticus]WCF11369.1 TerC family protein [Paenibacillus thiaminolyticus]
MQSFLNNFLEFFNWQHTVAILSDPVNWGIILTLVVLEGLLSADNALVLAVLVKHLPKEQQKKALFYGLLGAYVFRFLAISIGTLLVKITWVKVAGGLYLLWIACSHLFELEVRWIRIGKVPVIPYIGKKADEEDDIENKGRGFWRTVLTVELMDIAFSVDSVIAAFGVSDQVWVLFLGGILGVLMMRSVAQVFLKLIARYPELEKAAFVLIIIIGGKMLAAVIGFEMSHVLFFGLLVAVFAGTIILSALRRKRSEKTTKEAKGV